MARSTLRIVFALGVVLWLSPVTQAQRPRMLEPAEYGRWEQLVAQRTPLSADGRWLVYGITRASRDNELRVQSSDGGAVVKAVPFGEQPVFSDDSRWLAYLIGFSEEQEAKLRKDKKPLHKKLGLLELASGRETVIDGIESFSFSPSGSHLAMRRYAPEPAATTTTTNSSSGGTASPAPDETVAPGTTLVVRELATGCDTTFGSVSEIAWQDKGSLLAFAVTVEGDVGNGIQLFDSANGMLRVLDSSASTTTTTTSPGREQ